MKVNELIFKDTDSTGYSFIRQCLFKDEWQDRADEYNNAVKQLISASANTDEFVQKYLANTEWRKEQCYQAILKKYKPEKITRDLTEEQEHKYSPEIEELVNNIAACSDWAEANSYLDSLIYLAADSIEPYKGNYKADAKNDIIFYMWFQDNCFGVMGNYCQPLDMTDRDWDYAISRYERLQGEEIIKLACNALGVDFGDLL